MLEILADAGPMALPLWVVLLWSVSMYPLGFLFGACSECCDGCGPCSRCTHARNWGNCGAVPIEWSVQFGDYGSFSNDSAYTDNLSVPKFDVPPFPQFTNEECSPLRAEGVRGAQFQNLDSGFGLYPNYGECGCETCVVAWDFRFRVDVGDAYQTLLFTFGNNFAATSTALEQTDTSQATALRIIPDILADNGCWNGDITPYANWVQQVIEFLESIPVTVTVSFPSLDCGACCEAEPSNLYQCVPDVAVGNCSAEGFQGVGTDCDPDPCPPPEPLGACCVNGFCYEATETQCNADAGAWQPGPCTPSLPYPCNTTA